MKIGQPANKPPAAPTAGTAAPAGDVAKPTPTVKHEPAAAPVVDASSTVALSSTASNLLASGASDFDADKVAQVSGAIASGTFKVNPEAIADKLISNAQELLGRVKG